MGPVFLSSSELGSTVSNLVSQREICIEMTRNGPPARTKNPFFGVGPITDMVLDDAEGRKNTFAFNRWLEKNYRKLDDKGNDIGPFTTSEIGRSMHRGYPADAILKDMMHHVHRYFRFPNSNRVAVGLGGGHSGFTVAIMHLMNPNLEGQQLFVDTPKPESDAASAGGFFRQSWGTQILELQRFAENGHEDKVLFADREGAIPTLEQLEAMNVTLFVGVGHENHRCDHLHGRGSHLPACLAGQGSGQPPRDDRCDVNARCDALVGECGRGLHVQMLPVHTVPEGYRRHFRVFPGVLYSSCNESD